MISTIRVDLTWEGVPKEFCNQSEKKMKKTLKELTGAVDVDIIKWDSWDEDDDEYER